MSLLYLLDFYIIPQLTIGYTRYRTLFVIHYLLHYPIQELDTADDHEQFEGEQAYNDGASNHKL